MKEKDVADEVEKPTEEEIKVKDALNPDIKVEKKDEPSISYYKGEDENSDQDMDPETKSALPKLPFLAALPAIPELLSKFKMPNIKLPANIPSAPGGKGLHIKLGIALAAFILFIIMASFVYYNGILKADISVISDTKHITKTIS